MNYIKHLTVGGFQVFADQVTIPFGPLTLIYGPNSAGKSAILDAMLTLADLCDLKVNTSVPADSNQHRIGGILGRHWRRDNTMPTELSKELKLGANIGLAGTEWAEAGFAHRRFGFAQLDPLEGFESCYQILESLLTPVPVNVEVLIQYQLSKEGKIPISNQDFAQEQRIEILLNGSPILCFDEPAGLASINLEHPALLSWDAAADLKWIAQQYEDGFVTVQGWFGTRISGLHHGWLSTNAVDYIEHLLSPDVEPRVRAAETAFVGMFSALFRASLRSVSSTLRVPLVPASRAVPSRADVTFLLTADASLLTGEPIGIQVNGLAAHLEIARSAFVSEISRHENWRIPVELFGARLDQPSKDPVDLVNRLLSDYLFSSPGYFISAGVYELTSLGSVANDEMGSSMKDAGRKFLVSLELGDSAGRRFNLDEVGSGLGYVLPVLLAVATSRTCFLQQPELHLHPALQSQLADALIMTLADADFGGHNSRGCQQIIAETHSEHLLLRLLRRIRQAAGPERSLDPHSLGREDVVVLYVDPTPDGMSTVKHLRISREGEFIDRWPHGFFEERWTELFDE